MYKGFYNLKENPFNLTPDPRFIYFSEKHCEALANLAYGIRERKGFLVLSGEVGTGKTTLVNALIDTLDGTSILSAFIFNPILSSAEFFEYLLADLNLESDTWSKSKCLIKLNSLLLERYRKHQTTVLIIDEAQNLSSEILEEIRLLTNLETATEKLLQIVLVGQPELSLKLNSQELRQLKQRISSRCTLDPLTLSETKEYIQTRLEIAGLPNQQIFPDTSITEVFRCSGGIPRLINSICDNALLTGYACDRKTIGVEIIFKVSADLELFDVHRHLPRNIQSPKQRTLTENGAKQGDRASGEKNRHDSESFDLFVQFVEKLRDRVRRA